MAGKRILVALVLCCVMVIILPGCTRFSRDKKVDMVPVRPGEPIVYIHPLSSDLSQAKVVVLPFQVPDGVSPRQSIRIASIFRDVFLGKEVFHTVRLVEEYYGTFNEGLAFARENGVDLVVAGQVHYVLTGTELGGSRLDVSLRILDTHTGNTVWYIEQTMDQLMDYPDVSVIAILADIFTPARVRTSAGAPAVTNMINQVALDMADVVGGKKTGALM